MPNIIYCYHNWNSGNIPRHAGCLLLLTDTQEDAFKEQGVRVCGSIKELVATCDIVVSRMSSQSEVMKVLAGPDGLIFALDYCSDGESKSYVEMTTVSRHFAASCGQKIRDHRGRYLEVGVVGTLSAAENARLVFCCSGDKQAFNDMDSFFKRTGCFSFYFDGDDGSAWTFKAAVDLVRGALVGSLAEACALVEKKGFNTADLAVVLEHSSTFDLATSTLQEIDKGSFKPPKNELLSGLATSLKAAVGECHSVDSASLVTSAVCESFKAAERAGYGDHDAAALFSTIYSRDEAACDENAEGNNPSGNKTVEESNAAEPE